MIKAPWTKEQVDALNAFQSAGTMHPFTCPNDHGQADRTLIANEGGWYCQHCDYTQDWAHAFMAEPQPAKDIGDELKPHAYWPSTMHMGDCDICGHTQDAPIHRVPNVNERTSDIRKGVEEGRTPKPNG